MDKKIKWKLQSIFFVVLMFWLMKTCLIALRNFSNTTIITTLLLLYYFTTTTYSHIRENQCTATKVQTKYNKHAKILLIMITLNSYVRWIPLHQLSGLRLTTLLMKTFDQVHSLGLGFHPSCVTDNFTRVQNTQQP